MPITISSHGGIKCVTWNLGWTVTLGAVFGLGSLTVYSKHTGVLCHLLTRMITVCFYSTGVKVCKCPREFFFENFFYQSNSRVILAGPPRSVNTLLPVLQGGA
jgi:hypothetical protein